MKAADVSRGAVSRAEQTWILVSRTNGPVSTKRGPIISTLIDVCYAAVGPSSGALDTADQLTRVRDVLLACGVVHTIWVQYACPNACMMNAFCTHAHFRTCMHACMMLCVCS